ncbi:MAG TPA: phosphatidylserine decarboxylase [Gammaproteobacteria bacterium]|nr:phosphatidylserine decarboxylase [Gammaproteobacteria bacterium]
MSPGNSGTGWRDYLKALPLYLLPHHALSRLAFRLARIRTPWFRTASIRLFARHFRVDWSESLHTRPEDFEHFNAFFTRELAPGVRRLEGDDRTVASPADGCLSQAGAIRGDTLIQAKGRDFGLTELLGGREADAQAFRDGRFATIYLSPRDYHRVHMPLTGRLRATTYVPGRLFSVAPHTVRVVPRLFARNERLIARFDTDAGPMALILVGAINVAAIETVWGGQVTPPHRKHVEHQRFEEHAPVLERGAEMGRFNFGSTVILLFGRDAVCWQDILVEGAPLRMGEAIGRVCHPA